MQQTDNSSTQHYKGVAYIYVLATLLFICSTKHSHVVAIIFYFCDNLHHSDDAQ